VLLLNSNLRRAKLSNSQKPIVAVGTEFAAGKVVAIKSNGVELDTAEGVKLFSFSQIEGMRNQAIALNS
jgi:hypothetical protein